MNCFFFQIINHFQINFVKTNAKNQQENSSFLYWVVPGILAIVLALSYQYFTHRS
jgi:hypothetical protein